MPVDQHGEHPGEAVQAQRKAEAESGNPLGFAAQHPSLDDRRIGGQQQDEAYKRDAARQPGFGVTRVGAERCREDASHEGENDQDCQQYVVGH